MRSILDGQGAFAASLRGATVKCACPCGEDFEAERSNQKYVNAEHRQRDKNRRWPVRRQSKDGIASRSGRRMRQQPQTSGVTPLPGTERWPQRLTHAGKVPGCPYGPGQSFSQQSTSPRASLLISCTSVCGALCAGGITEMVRLLSGWAETLFAIRTGSLECGSLRAAALPEPAFLR